MRTARYIGRVGAPAIGMAAAVTPWVAVAEPVSPHTTFPEGVLP
jgi:hypothetical protein